VDWTDIVSGPSGLKAAIEAPTSGLEIPCIEMPNANTIFAAVAAVSGSGNNESFHYFLCEGTRQGSSNVWAWSKRLNLGGNDLVQTKLVTSMCLIPGTTTLVFGAKTKGSSHGGVFAVDYSIRNNGLWNAPTTWLDGDPNHVADYTPLGRNVTSLAAASTGAGGHVLYVGSSRHDSAFYEAYGGVARILIDAQGNRTREILSGPGSSWHFPLDDNVHPSYPAGVSSPGPGLSLIPCWAWCANVTDIAICPYDPLSFYVALNNESYHEDQTGVWRYSNSYWDHVWGGGESGAGARTVAVHPNMPNRLYVGSVGQEFFTVDVEAAARPYIVDTAEYPLQANTAGPVHSFAVEIMSASPIAVARVDLSSLVVAGDALDLNDEGEGDDVTAGDGIFTTSTRFAATLSTAGSHSASVYAQAADGRYSQRTVAIEVVANGARFADKSESTGDLYNNLPTNPDNLPYSSVYFNTDSDRVSGLSAMIVTYDDNVTPPLVLQRTGSSAGPWAFAKRNAGEHPSWLVADLAPGARGISWADFDNDKNTSNHSDVDFFICNPTSGGKLYRSYFAQGVPLFKDVTDSLFGTAGASELAGAVAATWGDYDRDGFVDLAVSTVNYAGSVKNLNGNAPSGSEIKIFKNVDGKHFDEIPCYAASSGPNICLSLVWVDLDKDGDQDLVAWHYLRTGGVSFFIENRSLEPLYEAANVQFTPSSLNVLGDWSGGMSASVVYCDQDTFPDLLVTEASGLKRCMILRNNLGPVVPALGAEHDEKSFGVLSLGGGRDWAGASVANFDGNPQADIIALPVSGEPALYMGTAAPAGGLLPTYRDLAFTLGLRPGETSGALPVDFDGSNSIDLFMGRIKTDEFMYSNVGPGGTQAPSKWVRLNLRTVGDSERTLIGTTITITAGGVTQTRVVSGGGDRGGQSPNQMLFGLGDNPDNAASVTVRYPSGEVDQFSAPVNQVSDAIENHPVVIKAGTKNDPEPDFAYDLRPGGADWIFRWRTIGVKGDITRDVVHVQNAWSYGEESSCYMGIAAGATLDLHWGDPGVAHKVYWDGTYWQHEVRWAGLSCATGCNYRFSVTSGLGDGTSSTSGMAVTTPITYCIPDMNEQ
jgi:hypothetical protein